MKTILTVLLLTSLIIIVPGCKCLQPEHRNDPICVVLHTLEGDLIDCTKDAAISTIPQFEPIVIELIAKVTGSDGKIDWPAFEASLGSLGIKDGGCLLADIEKQYIDPSAVKALPPHMMLARQSYRENFATFRQKKWPGVKFKVKRADGTTVVI